MGRTLRSTGLRTTALLVTLANTPPVFAQAVCSAPHSSPVLAGGGSIGTLDPRVGWVQASILGQRSTEFFSPTGERRPFLAEGRVRTVSVYLTSAMGVLRGADLWAQGVLHDVRYADQGGARGRTGVGDVRVALRVSPEIVGVSNVPIAVRAGAKLPGTEFPVDATLIPLTEGQRDWELSVESGHAFVTVPLYLVGWIGYRWREENDAVSRKPGNERFAHAAVGAEVAGVRWEIASEYLWGDAPRSVGFELPGAKRRLFQIVPTVGRRIGGGHIEVSLLVPVSGRSLPTGPALGIGYRMAWGNE